MKILLIILCTGMASCVPYAQYQKLKEQVNRSTILDAGEAIRMCTNGVKKYAKFAGVVTCHESRD